MTHTSAIDREKEILLYDSMLAGKIEERILFVQAESGWGKSILLDEFNRRKPKKFLFAKIDFKGGGTSTSELFSRMRDKLGGWDRFPNLKLELQSILHPAANVASNLLVGKNQIEVYLGGRDEQENQIRLAALTDSLFSDLRTFGKTLLMFDTYEQSDESIKKWITNSFLSRVQYSPNLFVVLAGQQVPEENLEWDCQRIPLAGIPHEHWHRYAQSINVTIHVEYIRGVCDYCHGHPLKMKNYIDSFLTRGN